MCYTVCSRTICHGYLPNPQTQPALPTAREKSRLSPLRGLQISPTNNALIEPQFDRQCYIYLAQQVIVEVNCLDDLLTIESGFYPAAEVHIRVVSILVWLSEEPKNPDIDNPGSVVVRPSEDRLKEILIATTQSLMMGIEYITRKAPGLPLWDNQKKGMALEKATLEALMLNGKNCVLWKRKDQSRRRAIASGRLGFNNFGDFCILQGNEKLFFSLEGEDILSGKFRIESGDTEGESYVAIGALPQQLFRI